MGVTVMHADELGGVSPQSTYLPPTPTLAHTRNLIKISLNEKHSPQLKALTLNSLLNEASICVVHNSLTGKRRSTGE